MVNDFYLILTRFATSWSNHELNCVFNHFILDQFSLIVVETWHSPSPRSSKWRVNPVFCLHFGYSIFMTLLTSFDDFTWIWWFFTFPDFFLLTIFFYYGFHPYISGFLGTDNYNFFFQFSSYNIMSWIFFLQNILTALEYYIFFAL